MKTKNAVSSPQKAKTVGLLHVLTNEGIYSCPRVDGRIVTIKTEFGKVATSIYVDKGNIEPLCVESWEDEQFTPTDEKITVDIR